MKSRTQEQEKIVNLIHALFNERTKALECLAKGDSIGATVHLEYMETVLSDASPIFTLS